MHMADALVSPAVGGALWAASAALMLRCARNLRQTLDDRRVPLMGVLGAFIFAAQMINFSIPLTGSSGHLGGGMILTILLGPSAAFIVIASVLTVQALFFADGGLLALGCNIINLGLFPAFVAYPLIFKPIMRGAQSGRRLWVAALLASIASLQMGAFGVVLETTLSGISDLPFRSFVLLMLPIHLAIGLVEGLVTASVVSFVWRTRPSSLLGTSSTSDDAPGFHRVVIGLLLAAVALGGVLSWFASSHPDGLEWAMDKSSRHAQLESPVDGLHGQLSRIQMKTAFLPDYELPSSASPSPTPVPEEPAHWPNVSAGTSIAGLVGGTITLALAGVIGYGLKRRAAA